MLPLADQAGSCSDAGVVVVSAVAPVPSGFMVQMSHGPRTPFESVRQCENAILPLGPGNAAWAGAATARAARHAPTSAALRRAAKAPLLGLGRRTVSRSGRLAAQLVGLVEPERLECLSSRRVRLKPH